MVISNGESFLTDFCVYMFFNNRVKTGIKTRLSHLGSQGKAIEGETK